MRFLGVLFSIIVFSTALLIGQSSTLVVTSTQQENGEWLAKVDFMPDIVRIASDDACTFSITRYLLPKQNAGLTGVPDILAPGAPLVDTEPVMCLGLKKAIWYDISISGESCSSDSVQSVELGCATESIAVNPRVCKCEGPDIGDECDCSTSAYWPIGNADPILREIDSFSLFSWQKIKQDSASLIPADYEDQGFLSPVQNGGCINRGQSVPVRVQLCLDGTGSDCIPFSDPGGKLFVSFAEVSPCFDGLAVNVPGASTTELPEMELRENGVYQINWQTPAESSCPEGGPSQYSITVLPAGYSLPALTTLVCAE